MLNCYFCPLKTNRGALPRASGTNYGLRSHSLNLIRIMPTQG